MPNDKATEKQGTVSVRATVTRNGVVESSRDENTRIEVRPFITSTASVSVKYGATIPMADYASARVDVMITLPCYVEEVMEVYHDLRATVDKLVSAEMDKMQGGR